MTESYAPPGWHPDPQNPSQERWWDGLGWTAFERPVAQESVGGGTFVSGVGGPTGSHYGATTGSFAGAPNASFPPEPRLRWGTVSAWLLALSPLFLIVPAVAVTIMQVFVGPAAHKPFPVAAMYFFFSLPLLLWAARDRDVLTRRGFDAPPSFLWVVLTPLAYLLRRASVTRSTGGRSLPIVFGVAVLTVVGGLAAASAAFAYLVPMDPARTEMSLSIEIERMGHSAIVDCPDEQMSYAPFKEITCNLVGYDGSVTTRPMKWGLFPWETAHLMVI